MNLRLGQLVRIAIVVIATSGIVNAQSNEQWYGGAEDVAFAKDLWSAMLQNNLVGENATDGEPYIGIHPHGAILEVTVATITVRGVSNTIASKRSYRGTELSIEAVKKDREAYMQDVTVMFKRESGYDSLAQNWFWAKYNPDGSLDTTPNGIELAGRVAKGRPKGCIACHLRAEGGDLMFVN